MTIQEMEKQAKDVDIGIIEYTRELQDRASVGIANCRALGNIKDAIGFAILFGKLSMISDITTIKAQLMHISSLEYQLEGITQRAIEKELPNG